MALIELDVTPAVQTGVTMRSTATGLYSQMRATFDYMQNLVFANPYGLSIQEAFAALGTDGGTIISFAEQLKTVINTYAAQADKVNHHTPPGVVLTVNPNGTVTVS